MRSRDNSHDEGSYKRPATAFLGSLGVRVLTNILNQHTKHRVGNLGTVNYLEPHVPGLIDGLLRDLSSEGPVLSSAYSKLQTLASGLATMSISGALKAFVANLVEGILLFAPVVVEALLDVIKTIGVIFMGIASTKRYVGHS